MAKKKIKKLLKKVLPALAIAGMGAAALGRRRRNNSIANNEAKEFGFGQMKLKDYGPFSIRTTRSQMPKEPKMLTPDDYNSDFFTGAMAKKGGRIVKTKSGGKALRGYGRAYTKGRK
jgi:hypothetical protein|tara:strand:- start:391 stop:741 length:351 start_codon:yes stop_codon:yes gene_type:complete